MKNLIRKSGEMVFFRFLCISLFFVWGLQVNAQVKDEQPSKGAQTRYPLPSGKQDGNPKQKPVTGLHLPAGNTSYVVDYDPLSGLYRVQKKVGVTEVGMPRYMDMAEYQKFEKAQASTNYFKDKVLDRDSTQDVERSIFKRFLNPTIDIEGFDKIFGSNKISIKPTGSAELRFGVNVSTQDNPSLEESLRTTTTFDFNEKIQMGVTGEIGTKLKVGINYNTEATFDFENKTKVGYTGDEDEIIQSIEAGNVSVPLNGTLITGGQNLFGVKTQLKFGRLKLTGVVSQQKSETQVVELKGGALQQEFSVTA
ncbi:MAG: hypothetical protein RIS47_1849, partial [Bacteroidota bacterium]